MASMAAYGVAAPALGAADPPLLPCLAGGGGGSGQHGRLGGKGGWDQITVASWVSTGALSGFSCPHFWPQMGTRGCSGSRTSMQILSGEMWSGACSAKAVGAANATLPANAKPCNFHRDIGISCLRAAWRIAKPLRIFERAADNLTNADFRGDIVPRSCYAYALIPLMLEAAQRMARGLRHGECWVDCVAARAIYDNIKRDEKRFGELKEALAVANFGPGHLSRIRGEDIPGQVPKTYRPMGRQNVANFAKACGVTPEKLLLGGTGLELPHEPAAPATSEGTKGGIPQAPLARLDVNAPELPNLAGFDESRAAPGLSFDPTAAPDLPLKRSLAPPVGEENQLVPPSNASLAWNAPGHLPSSKPRGRRGFP